MVLYKTSYQTTPMYLPSSMKLECMHARPCMALRPRPLFICHSGGWLPSQTRPQPTTTDLSWLSRSRHHRNPRSQLQVSLWLLFVFFFFCEILFFFFGHVRKHLLAWFIIRKRTAMTSTSLPKKETSLLSLSLLISPCHSYVSALHRQCYASYIGVTVKGRDIYSRNNFFFLNQPSYPSFYDYWKLEIIFFSLLAFVSILVLTQCMPTWKECTIYWKQNVNIWPCVRCTLIIIGNWYSKVISLSSLQ